MIHHLADLLAATPVDQIFTDTLDTWEASVNWLKTAIAFVCSIGMAGALVKLWLEG